MFLLQIYGYRTSICHVMGSKSFKSTPNGCAEGRPRGSNSWGARQSAQGEAPDSAIGRLEPVSHRFLKRNARKTSHFGFERGLQWLLDRFLAPNSSHALGQGSGPSYDPLDRQSFAGRSWDNPPSHGSESQSLEILTLKII